MSVPAVNKQIPNFQLQVAPPTEYAQFHLFLLSLSLQHACTCVHASIIIPDGGYV